MSYWKISKILLNLDKDISLIWFPHDAPLGTSFSYFILGSSWEKDLLVWDKRFALLKFVSRVWRWISSVLKVIPKISSWYLFSSCKIKHRLSCLQNMYENICAPKKYSTFFKEINFILALEPIYHLTAWHLSPAEYFCWEFISNFFPYQIGGVSL